MVLEEALIRRIPETVSSDLIAIPTTKEVRDALFSIHPDKAPGPDGFSSGFFRTN